MLWAFVLLVTAFYLCILAQRHQGARIVRFETWLSGLVDRARTLI